MDKGVKVYEFNPQIYPRLLWIAITTNSKIEGFDELSQMDSSCRAVVEHAHNSITDKGGVMIRFSNVDEIGYETIAHESAHSAMEIIDYIGGIVDLKNQEYFCYLVGWVAKCCKEVLEKEKEIKTE